MAEYNITVELLATTLSSMTGAQIVTALELLTGTNRLHATAIQGLPDGTGVVTMTGAEIIAAINADGGVNNILYNEIGLIPKGRILHGENSLNWIATVDPRSTAFQNQYLTPNTDRIKKMDVIIVAQVFQTTEIFQNGDWVIALADNPGFTYNDTAKWLIMPFSKIAQILPAVFQKHVSTVANSGIESINGTSSATGAYSFAAGNYTVAQGEASTALGLKSKALRKGDVAESSGIFASVGDSQRTRSSMRLTTTSGVSTLMTSPFQYFFEDNKSYLLKIVILAVVKGGKKAKSWEYLFIAGVDSDGYLPQNGGVTTNPQNNWDSIEYGTPAISVSVLINQFDAMGPPPPGAFKGLSITCTGIVNTTVYWSAFVEAFEIGSL